MTTHKSLNRYAVWIIRAFAACLVIFYCVYFLGLISAKKQQALFFGIFSIGIFSIWAAYFYHCTKRPIYRRYQNPAIDFNKDPGNHNSSVLTFVILGVLFVTLGINGIFHA